MVTQAELKTLVNYNPETGIFIWKSHPSKYKQHLIGKVIGSITPSGYLEATILYGRYRLHRLAWLYVYGSMPENYIDHINHNKIDNSISNLREVTNSENQRNQKLLARNTSGFTGVNWSKKQKHWRAVIGHKGKDIFLGCFKEKDDAIAARKKANLEYGYHENHGKRFN